MVNLVEDGARVLIVDGSSEIDRNLLARQLRSLGLGVEAVADGPTALDRLSAGGFDLIVLDSDLQEPTCGEVLAILKVDPVLRHLPVLISTATGSPDLASLLELGATDYVPKPVDATLLKCRVGAALARKRLHDREQIHARSVTRELEIGRWIQASFLPDALPQHPGWEIDVRFRPARPAGGDFYDVFPAADGEAIVLLAGEVCDSGVESAAYMAIFRTLLRAFAAGGPGAPAPASRREELANAVTRANDYMARNHGRAHLFATLFLGFLDPVDGRLHFVNAGHEEPAVLHSDGRLERLSPTGPAVGLLPGPEFRVSETILAPGAVLLAFTDGIPDSRGATGQAFTEERLLGHLVHAPEGAGRVLAAIETDLEAHTLGADPFDDITLLAVKRV